MATRNFEIASVPSLSGKVVIVTGANTGIGKACAEVFASRGAHVFLACRDETKTAPIIEEIKKKTGNEKVEFLRLDLLSLQSVKEAAETFKRRGLPLHILMNNAGTMACPFGLSKDGIETQFATNHVSHFYFTMLLLPILQSSAPSRVISVSSEAHQRSPKGLALDVLNDESKYEPWEGYGRTKLANILFATELNRRLEERGIKNIYVNSNHPGVVMTDLGRHLSQEAVAGLMAAYQFTTPDEGCITQLYVATSPEIEEKDIRGKYFVPFGVEEAPSAEAQDAELAKKLWDFTENLLKEKVSGYEGSSQIFQSLRPSL